jgi:hypothetical protein
MDAPEFILTQDAHKLLADSGICFAFASRRAERISKTWKCGSRFIAASAALPLVPWLQVSVLC